MKSLVQQVLNPGPYEEPEIERIARLLVPQLLAGVGVTLTLFVVIPLVYQRPLPVIVINGVLLLVHLLALGLVRLARIRLAIHLYVTALCGLFTAAAAVSGGVRSPASSVFILLIVGTGLILGVRSGLIYALLSVASLVGLLILEERNALPPQFIRGTSLTALTFYIAVFASLLVLVALSQRGIQDVIRQLKHNEAALARSNTALVATRASLEERVEERTRDLRRRAVQLQVAAEVARDASTTHEPARLLDHSVTLIRDRFGFYHAAIFLIDEEGEYAVLRASSSEAGRSMIAKGHRLRVGEEGIVGYVARTGQPRLALDVGKDAIHLKNPLLHETRSEVTVPLKIGDEVMGVLDVQSREPAAFDEDDVAVLHTLADQLAVAIENSRLFEQMSKRVTELTILHGIASALTDEAGEDAVIARATAVLSDRLMLEDCGVFLLEPGTDILRTHPSYRATRASKPRTTLPIGRGIVGTAARERKPLNVPDVSADERYLLHEPATHSEMAVPILAGEELVGVINAESPRPAAFTEDDLRLMETLAGQLATAILKARLFDELQALNRELEQRITERTAQLEAANRELESFSYSVSHDLRAPLRAMDGFSRILLEEYGPQLPPEATEDLKMVREGAQEMGQLIDDLLAYSRLSRQEVHRQRVEPGEVVAEAIKELRVEMEAHPVELVMGTLPACHADPALLRRVYANLIANAIKFTRGRDPARIEVGANEEDGRTVYYVKDNGIGFDMRYVGKIFGVFQRLHRSEEYDGTGVGLAIVRGIVNRHGGQVWAEAAPDEGASFFFTLGSGEEHE